MFIDVHGTRTKVSSAAVEWNQRDLHQGFLELDEPSPTFAAVALYAYRVDFGGDPPDFAELVASLPEDHIWTTEHSVANLAWIMPRVHRLLDLLQTREGKTDNRDELDERVRYLSPITLGVDKFEALSAVGGMEFFSMLPVELLSWP